MNSESDIRRKCVENLTDSELDSIIEQSLNSYDGTNGVPMKEAFKEIKEYVALL